MRCAIRAGRWRGPRALTLPLSLNMIDIRLLREDVGAVKTALARRGVDAAEVDRLVSLDTAARAAIGHRDDLRAQVKSLSKQVGEARRAKDTDRAEALTAESRRIGSEERDAAEVAEASQEAVRQALLLSCPTCPPRTPPTAPVPRTT